MPEGKALLAIATREGCDFVRITPMAQLMPCELARKK